MDNKIFKVLTIFLVADMVLVISSSILTLKKIKQQTPVSVQQSAINSLADDEVLPVNAETDVLLTEETAGNETLEFTVNMNFIGDLLLATDEYTSYENCFNDVADSVEPDYFLSQVSDIFLNDDITVGDCENVFSDNNGLTVSDKGQYAAENDDTFQAFWFRSKASNANIISAGGVDIVSIDNNHINDYGQQGKDDTKAALEAAGVEWGNSGKIVYRGKRF